MKPDTGDWLKESIYSFTFKNKVACKYSNNIMFAMGDYDNDGADVLVNSKSSSTTKGSSQQELTTELDSLIIK
jgi:glutamine cyclotransferase